MSGRRMKFRPVKRSGDYSRTFSTEDGKHYRGQHQNLDAAMDRVKYMETVNSAGSKASNPNEWQYVGSVPQVILFDWLQKNHYTMHDWAVNNDGCKDKFKKFFFTRDFSKFHNQHLTTKRDRSSIVMPGG